MELCADLGKSAYRALLPEANKLGRSGFRIYKPANQMGIRVVVPKAPADRSTSSGYRQPSKPTTNTRPGCLVARFNTPERSAAQSAQKQHTDSHGSRADCDPGDGHSTDQTQ